MAWWLVLLFCSLVSSELEVGITEPEVHKHNHDEPLTIEHRGDVSDLDPEKREILANALPEELARRLGLRNEEPIDNSEDKKVDLEEVEAEKDTASQEDSEVIDKRPLLGLVMALRINDIPFCEKSLASILPFVDTYSIILEEKEITAKAKRFSERNKRNTFSEDEKKEENEEEAEEQEESEDDTEEGEVETEESILEQNTRGKQRVQEIINEYFKVQKTFETGAAILEERGTQYVQKPGELLQLPFVDFSTAKNQALENLGLKTIFAIVLQPEEVFTGDGSKLRQFCEDHIYSDGVDHEVYLLPYQHSNRTQYYLERLIRTGYSWYYFGSTYEALIKSGVYAKIRAPEFLSVAFRHVMSPEQQKERWELNKKLLEKDYQADQNNTRTLFYLAQTYANLNEWGKAFVFYDKRARAGGWKEEVYDALYSKAYSASQVKRPWHEVQHYYLHAFSQSGAKRAEPLYALAYQYFLEQEYPLCYLFASVAAQTPFPKDSTLFIDGELYQWRAYDVASLCAYNVEKYEESVNFVQKALNSISVTRSPELYRRLNDNLVYFKTALRKQQNDAFRTFAQTANN